MSKFKNKVLKKIIKKNNFLKKLSAQLFVFSLLMIFISSFAFAEGKPSVSPFASNITTLVNIPEIAGGLYLKAPVDNRVYFKIANSNIEKLFFGYDWSSYTDNQVLLKIDFRPCFKPLAWNLVVNSNSFNSIGVFNITRKSIYSLNTLSMVFYT